MRKKIFGLEGVFYKLTSKTEKQHNQTYQASVQLAGGNILLQDEEDKSIHPSIIAAQYLFDVCDGNLDLFREKLKISEREIIEQYGKSFKASEITPEIGIIIPFRDVARPQRNNLALLSDLTAEPTQAVLSRFFLTDSFRAAASRENNDFAPRGDSSLSLQKALSELKTKPEEADVIEAIPENLLEAKKLGCRTVLVTFAKTRSNSPLPPHIDLRVNSPAEALSIR